LIAAAYVRIRSNESLSFNARASAVICYPITGSGNAGNIDEQIAWKSGDVFLFPGGSDFRISAANGDAVLWLASNEPQLRFDGFYPPTKEDRQTDLVHFRKDEMLARLDELYGQEKVEYGRGILLSSNRQDTTRRIVPSMTLGLNSVPPKGFQQAHKHNAAAVTLIIQGDQCYSLIDGKRHPWENWSTMITPPGAVHSHHNDGSERALFLVVQDGGLYYFARTMGFAFST
jgi:gentisate 1,2-dioxygenase